MQNMKELQMLQKQWYVGGETEISVFYTTISQLTGEAVLHNKT